MMQNGNVQLSSDFLATGEFSTQTQFGYLFHSLVCTQLAEGNFHQSESGQYRHRPPWNCILSLGFWQTVFQQKNEGRKAPNQRVI
ncbi:MAG TPA: hypothetical protein PKZ53_24415, partial [Acidobacteriota bacterium]|nr:hypothetical protein [Acidobacteriota bacterium]